MLLCFPSTAFLYYGSDSESSLHSIRKRCAANPRETAACLLVIRDNKEVGLRSGRVVHLADRWQGDSLRTLTTLHLGTDVSEKRKENR